LNELLSIASNAPSAINMQPWEVHMVLGTELKRVSRRLLRSYKERNLTCSPGTNKPVPGRFIDRAKQCADSMGPLAERMGSDFKTYVNEGSLNFYGAPAAAFIVLDEAFTPDRMTDVGAFTGYFVLAAAGLGLGTCPIGLIRGYADEVKDCLNIQESKLLVLSIAVGYPNHEAAINEFLSSRADLTEFVRWID
jgi:nitroreductase